MQTEGITAAQLAALIDHTALAPTVGQDAIDRLCDEAAKYGFRNVCVAPAWVERAAARLSGRDVGVCAVVGFPLGNTLRRIKVAETEEVVALGAAEVDVVLALGSLLEGRFAEVRDELSGVVEAAGPALVKVIVETAYLSPPLLDRACDLSLSAGAAFVKTSTGFAPYGANAADVARMRARVGDRAGIKASGGIRDTESALAMIAAGANRLGASASVAIVRGLGSAEP